MKELSPMMRQYFEIKGQHPDAVLFFRLGDFYEMFFEDAKLVAPKLDLALTARDCGAGERAPMCGVPHHSAEGYIARLVEQGLKVAICEQVGDAAGKGLVRREVVRVVTPGTVIESTMLDEAKNNFICVIFLAKEAVGLCFCDVSTGELSAVQLLGDKLLVQVRDELAKFSPKEVLIGGETEKNGAIFGFIKEKLCASVEKDVKSKFSREEAKTLLKEQFGRSTEELGLEGQWELQFSLCQLINYLRATQKLGLERITWLNVYTRGQFLRMDSATRVNLELVENLRTKGKRGSLLWVLDKTQTSMGKRLLRRYVEQPLVDVAAIRGRQKAVQELFENVQLGQELQEKLSGIVDLERLMTRIVYGSANARELLMFKGTLEKLPPLKGGLIEVRSEFLRQIEIEIDPLQGLCQLLQRAIDDDPPVSVKEGGLIKSGFCEKIDELRGLVSNGKEVLAKIEQREKERTGLSRLKIAYNRVFGYFIEVPNSARDKVPEDYHAKQTLSNCQRYVTQELKELEEKILTAKDKLLEVEYAQFCEVRKEVAGQLSQVQKTAQGVARLDVILSLAKVARENDYVLPKIDDSDEILLKDSRHPVVERILQGSFFVPNDAQLDTRENMVNIITGPNMAGKSTFMRQVALIVLMAQMGSFVPAKSAKIGIVDKIFTRIGASDDLSSGQSTFMVEMTEVAQIMNEGTNRSLIVLDEIGRGTSTFDGMSIARAVVEYVVQCLQAKTLFSTHYHELAELEKTLRGIKNYNISVRKRGDDIVFLRRIVRGGCDDSYGIEVAKLAGVPGTIVFRAKEILRELETFSQNVTTQSPRNVDQPNPESLFEKLQNLDINTITPVEAMSFLFELKKGLEI